MITENSLYFDIQNDDQIDALARLISRLNVNCTPYKIVKSEFDLKIELKIGTGF